MIIQRRDVISALHATDKAEAWTECQSAVFHNLDCKKSPASVTLLPGLLEKVPIMLFAGDQDFICNYMGIEAIIGDLEWQGSIGMGVGLSGSSVSMPAPYNATHLSHRMHQLSRGRSTAQMLAHGKQPGT